MMAVGCLFALGEAGVRVPAQLAVAGFDDIPLARFLAPPLTTMRVHIAELGRRATQALLATLQGNAVAPHQLLVPELVVRESCAAPPRRGDS
jgi:LacI family transcriptional regulator